MSKNMLSWAGRVCNAFEQGKVRGKKEVLASLKERLLLHEDNEPAEYVLSDLHFFIANELRALVKSKKQGV